MQLSVEQVHPIVSKAYIDAAAVGQLLMSLPPDHPDAVLVYSKYVACICFADMLREGLSTRQE